MAIADIKKRKKSFEIEDIGCDLLKIKPDSRLTGTFYDEIVSAMYSTHRGLKELGGLQNKDNIKEGFSLGVNNPIGYEFFVDGENKPMSPAIYFAIPTNHTEYMKQRIQATLPQSTITIEPDYTDVFDGCYYCEYNYEKDSMLSLKIKDNNFLQSMMNLKNDIEPNEKILFQVQMTPLSDTWKTFQDDKWDKVRQGKDAATKRNIVDKGFELAFGIVNEVFGVVDMVMDYDPPKKGKTKMKDKDGEDVDRNPSGVKMSNYSSASKTKKNSDGFAVTIKAYFVCSSKMKARHYATTIETALRDLEEDNRLVMGDIKQKGEVVRGASLSSTYPFCKNIMSLKEVASIVNIPNQKLQRQFNMKAVNTKEVNAPRQMLKGKILLGYLTKRGETVGVYMSDDRDLTCLPLFLMTKMGGGKTTFILNACNDAIKAGHGLVLFDYIKNCDTANALQKMHKKCREIVFDEWGKLCTFAFPEVEISDNDTPYQKRVKANTLAVEVKYLLNSMASDTEHMSRIMSEYLTAACKVVFINNRQTLQSVYDVLTDEETRNEYISKAIENDIFTEKSFEVKKLLELNDNPNAAKGVLDRFSVINEDTLFQEMMMKPYDSNVNFVDIMDSAEPVIIKMPQDIFTSKLHKDAICTYFMSRIRLAMSRRKNFDNIAHIVVDELHQIPNTMKLVADTIAEPRKFSMQYLMSLHALSQIEDKKVRDKIMGVGCNFMLLKGLSPQAFEEFKPFLSGEWEYEDVINMDHKFGSLNLFMVDNSYKTFITELPLPLKDNSGKLYIGK